MAASLTPATAAEHLHSVEQVLANLPSNVAKGFVCSAHGELYVAPDETCLTPVGVGIIAKQWSNGKYTYAMVNDLNGNTLCLAGRVSELSGHLKIAPLPADAGARVTLDCMAKFNQLAPVPVLSFVVWY